MIFDPGGYKRDGLRGRRNVRTSVNREKRVAVELSTNEQRPGVGTVWPNGGEMPPPCGPGLAGEGRCRPVQHSGDTARQGGDHGAEPTRSAHRGHVPGGA